VGRRIVYLAPGEVLFNQGDSADAVFYLQQGHAKVTVVSRMGKQATVALLSVGDFAGEESIGKVPGSMWQLPQRSPLVQRSRYRKVSSTQARSANCSDCGRLPHFEWCFGTSLLARLLPSRRGPITMGAAKLLGCGLSRGKSIEGDRFGW
jgi:hypothetical protein